MRLLSAFALSAALVGACLPGQQTRPEGSPRRAAAGGAAQDGASQGARGLAPAILQKKLERASSPGYRMLLRQLHVPGDRARFGDFFDHGALRVDRYQGHAELPPGYWVYVHPYWYVWRDRLPVNVSRSYGPERAAGPPDVTTGGDSLNAWCPKRMDTEAEWLLAEFAAPVKAVAALVHETYSPGSVSRITLFALDGREVDAWRAAEPAPLAETKRMFRVALPLGFVVARMKVYLAPKRARGWNEIDALGLEDDKGKKHWAHAVAASTTYAGEVPNIPADAPRKGPSPDAEPKPRSAVKTAVGPHSTLWVGDHPIIRAVGIAPAPVPAANTALLKRIELLEKRVEVMHEMLARIEKLLADQAAARERERNRVPR